ncbi:hypothetical protein SAMN05421759_1311 [Roseivivax lentus]|uniref:Uncharacterized protein n=1 Tax=Roseivivax lentus TaxID=633194 RepID=A0A1N7Q7G0_9RHOB|nr:hypothetical protein [Roseivivax lentus]SIT18517.1 hypothetical protein SAMN05421759_1311 [Roseivivax lentus]
MAGAAFAAPAYAHTPYGQWVVYRQKHLLIGSHRGDFRTYELAKDVVAALSKELPEAQARVARGPRPQRIASLMGTGQLFLAVLSADEAARMERAEAPFEGNRPIPVHALAALDSAYLLFAAPEFPEEHGRLVTEAVDHAGLGTRPTWQNLHAGAVAYWS